MLGHADEAVKTVQCRAFGPMSRVKCNLNLEFAPGHESDEAGLA
jgi:hypothetical protein